MWYQSGRFDSGSLKRFSCSKPKFEHDETSWRIVMVMTANLFKLDLPESYMDKEMTRRSKVAVQRILKVAVQRILAHGKSKKKKKKKKASVKRHDSEVDDNGGKKTKKRKIHKRVSGGDEIENTKSSKVNEGSRSYEKALVNSDDDGAKRDKGKRRHVDCGLGNTAYKAKKKNKEKIQREDPEIQVSNNNNKIKTENPKADVKKSTKYPKEKMKKQKVSKSDEVDDMDLLKLLNLENSDALNSSEADDNSKIGKDDMDISRESRMTKTNARIGDT